MGRVSAKKKKCQKLSLDDLVKRTKWALRPHADHVYSYGAKAVVVEETGRPEYHDLEKLRESIEMLKNSNIFSNIKIIAGIVHYERSDTMFNKMITSEASRKPPILPANCHNRLRALLEELLGCVY